MIWDRAALSLDRRAQGDIYNSTHWMAEMNLPRRRRLVEHAVNGRDATALAMPFFLFSFFSVPALAFSFLFFFFCADTLLGLVVFLAGIASFSYLFLYFLFSGIGLHVGL